MPDSRSRARVSISSTRTPGVTVSRPQVTASVRCNARACVQARPFAVIDRRVARSRHEVSAAHQEAVFGVKPVDAVVVVANAGLDAVCDGARLPLPAADHLHALGDELAPVRADVDRLIPRAAGLLDVSLSPTSTL